VIHGRTAKNKLTLQQNVTTCHYKQLNLTTPQSPVYYDQVTFVIPYKGERSTQPMA